MDAVALEDKVAKSFVAMARGFIKGDELEILTEDSMSAAMLHKRMPALKSAASAVCGHPVEITVTVKKTSKQADSGLLD